MLATIAVEFHELYNYVHRLTYIERPDYNHMRQLMVRCAMDKIKSSRASLNEYRFEWNHVSQSSNQRSTTMDAVNEAPAATITPARAALHIYTII